MKDQYSLELYPPGECDASALSLKSDVPFMAIHVGDLINTRTLSGRAGGNTLLRVVNVEHVLAAADSGVHHTVIVYTEPYGDTKEARIYGRAKGD